MYGGVSAQPLNFSYGFGYPSRRRIYWGSCSNRNGRQEDVSYMTNCHRISWKDQTNSARKVNLINLPQVCSGNADGFSTDIKYGLEMPCYATLPRVEARFLLEHYRMPDLNGETNLEVAKLDYNRCQAQHQIEWNQLQQWYEDHNVEEFGISKKDVLGAYFLAAASIFVQERSPERLAWVKSQVLATILSAYYCIKEADSSSSSSHQRVQFSTPFGLKLRIDQHTKGYKNIQRIITILFETLHQLKKDAKERIGNDIGDDLLQEAVHKIYEEVDKEMQEVEQLVLRGSSNGISKDIKETFLAVAKTFYYRAYSPTEQIENHIAKVLFEQVV